MTIGKEVKNKPSISKFEEYVLYLITLFIPIVTIPQWTYEYSTQKYAFFSILAFITFFAAFMETRRQNKLNLSIPLPVLGWGLFGVATLLSLITVASQDLPYLRYSAQVSLYIVMTFFFTVYLLNRVKEKRVMINILGMLLISAGFITLDAFLNFYAGWDIWLGKVGSAYSRASIRSTIGNADFVPDYLGVMLFVALYFIMSKTLGFTVTKENAKKIQTRIAVIKSLVTVEAVAMVAVIIFAQTRGDYIAVPLSLVFVALTYTYYHNFRSKKTDENPPKDPSVASALGKIRRLSGILVIVFIAFILLEFVLYSIPGPFTGNSFSLFGRVSTISSATTAGGSGQQRFLAWWASFYQWKDHPIVGQGIGTYQTNVLHYLGVAVHHHPQLIIAWNNFKRTHNDYLQVLGETGIIGFLSIVFTLVTLLIFYLKVLKKQTEDNAYLMMMLAGGSLVTLMTSVLSFAEHLMPNSMTLMFLLAFLSSNLFNRDGDMTWKVVLDKGKILAAAIVTLFIAGTTMVLKFTNFVSEVYFLDGNINYQYISAYQNAANQASGQLQSVEKELTDLKNYSGKYAYLEPKTYIAARIQNLMQNNPALSQTQASIQLEQQRQQEYNNYLNQLNSNKQNLENSVSSFQTSEMKNYNDASQNFLDSLVWDWTQGTSEFYLGLLSTFPQRDQQVVNELNGALKSSPAEQLVILKKVFYGEDPLTSFISSKYRRLNYTEDYTLIQKMVDSGKTLVELWNSLNINQLLQMQFYRDGIDYLQTSFLSFDEKNSYRLIGQFSATLYHMERQQIDVYKGIVDKYPNFKTEIEKLITYHENLAKSDLKEMEKWYDQTIFILPGGWNRYPGWQDVYSEYINNILRDTPLNLQTYDKIKQIAEKYVWIGRYMQTTYWAIPSNVMDIFSSVAQNFINNKQYSEALTVVNDTLKIFKPAYDWNVKDLPRWKNNSKIYDQIEKFISSYEALKSKRVDFLNQLKNVYNYTFTNPNQKTLAESYLKDWNDNSLRSTELNMSTSDIIASVTSMLSTPSTPK